MSNQQTLDFINANRNSLTLASLQDAQVNDYVIRYCPGGWSHGEYSIVQVTRATKTQIICGNERYSRETGNIIGGYSRSEVSAPLGKAWHDNSINLENVVRNLQAWIKEDLRSQLVKNIIDTLKSRTLSVGFEALQKTWEIIQKDISNKA